MIAPTTAEAMALASRDRYGQWRPLPSLRPAAPPRVNGPEKQVDAMSLRHTSVVRADTIAAIRGIGQPVGEIQDVHHSRYLITRAGMPAAMARDGIGFVTTAPAATIASSPTSASTTAALPIHAPRPTRTQRRAPGCSRMGTSSRE